MNVDSEVSTIAQIVPVSCVKCGWGMEFEVQGTPPGDLVAHCPDCRTEFLEKPTLPAPYHFVRELGRGWMGAVYLAWHPTLQLERAVKVVLPKDALSGDARSRFLTEARLHARLTHPRVVQVYDLSEIEPAVFAIVMEYVPGRDASKLLTAEGRPGLDPRVAVRIGQHALEALAYVHGQGIVHCDVKDPNLLVAEPGHEAKLSDFGLARSYAAAGPAHAAGEQVTSGTIAYMAPEQARGAREVGPHADVYAVGATLYRLLAGCYAHTFTEGCNRLHVVRDTAPVPLRERAPDVPEALGAVVDRALQREPSARWESADAMRAALAAALPA